MPETPVDATSGDNRTKEPKDSDFKQQKLPAWQPVLTASSVLPTFFVVGFAFLPIAIGLFFSSSSVQEFQLEYTNCYSKNGSNCADILEEKKADMIANNGTNHALSCQCETNFTLTAAYTKNVFLYYKLTNFYQNHRRYVKSRDDNQLAGKLKPSEMPSTDCAPFRDIGGVPIAPCGAVANSLFNDTLKLLRCLDDECKDPVEVPVLKTNIAWPTDKSTKFQNPEGKTLKEAFNGSIRPPFWSKDIWDLDMNGTNNGYQNEDLIVWMRTAALPNFRKLYRRVDHSVTGYKDGLPNGTYKLIVEYNYPVTSFEGTKTLILANTSWMGGKNNFLAIAYLVVSIICILLGFVFLVIHIKMPAPSNNQNAAGAASSVETEGRRH